MTTEVTIPDFNFTGFYYAELLEALIEYKRINVPEHTDESAYDGFIQLCRMMALVGHLNNANIDLVANESTLPTAKLQETVREMLKLIDYDLASATPSNADMIYKLAKVFNASYQIVPIKSQVSTEQSGEDDPVFFENLIALDLTRTDQFSKVFADDGGVFTDYTTKANSQVTPGDDWIPWSTAVIKDAIYFGHYEAMWNQLNLYMTTKAVDITGVWEYYDGDWQKVAPSSVSNLGAGVLKIYCNSYLGSTSKEGTIIRVMLNETTSYEDLESQWDGVDNYVETTTYLGQTSPSVVAGDYTIGSEWQEFETIADGTNQLTIDGNVVTTLPQSVTENWIEGTVNSVEAFWMRFRVVAIGGGLVDPVFQYGLMDEGDQYVTRVCTQGKTQIDNPLASSTGTPNQRHEATQENFIDGSMEVTVDGETWTEVDNFLSSTPTNKHFKVELGDDETAIVVFGDGVTGSVPPVGVGNIVATYRYEANENGNVGSNTINLDKTGLTYVSEVLNPRSATGWKVAEGSTDTSLELAKIAGPASIRVGDVALNGDDMETLAKAFVASDGSSPFSRALAIEEGYGAKTVKLVVVGTGGGVVSSTILEEFDLYMNGDRFASPPVESHIVANTELTSINYTPVTIAITATVTGDVTAAVIESHLASVFQPEALRSDGITYEWAFGEDVPVSRIVHEIFEASEEITNVVVSVPGSDVAIATDELPIIGTIILTIV